MKITRQKMSGVRIKNENIYEGRSENNASNFTSPSTTTDTQRAVTQLETAHFQREIISFSLKISGTSSLEWDFIRRSQLLF